MADCLFCKIVAGEIPSKEVLSTERTYSFYDINPAAPVHVLVVPRQHITNAAEVEPEHAEILAEMFTSAQAVAAPWASPESGYRLVFNVGEHALNSVPTCTCTWSGATSWGGRPVEAVGSHGSRQAGLARR
jgi:histidine triad (HIT) family protein